VPTRRVFLFAFAGFFLLAAAWAVALPVNGTYDEKQHLVRAYAVWTGQFIPHARAVDATGHPTDAITGPRSLLPDGVDCAWYPKPPKPADCQQAVTSREQADLPTAAGRYSPVYYLLVGLPLRLSPDQTGLIWARLLSAAVSAVLLAAAAAITTTRTQLTALVLISTPLAMNLNGAVNPNGLEISAGVLLFTALLDKAPTLAGVGAFLLWTVRHLGPVLLVLAVLAGLVATRIKPTKTFLAFNAAGAAFFTFWLLASRVTAISSDELRPLPLGIVDILDGMATNRAEFYVRQIVGQFGYGETAVSPLMILTWYGLIAALVVPALWVATWRIRIAVAGIVVACGGLLAALEIHFVPLVGWYAHGRYIMPLGVGAVIIAVWRSNGRFLVALALATVPLDLYAMVRVMTRFQVGMDAALNPFGGTWQPATGPIAPLLACLVGGLLLTVTVAKSSVRAVPETSTVAA
jgi:hypothetical protein